jgi:hypothetical protein
MFYNKSKNSVSNQLVTLRSALLVQKLFKAFSVQGCSKLSSNMEHGIWNTSNTEQKGTTQVVWSAPLTECHPYYSTSVQKVRKM